MQSNICTNLVCLGLIPSALMITKGVAWYHCLSVSLFLFKEKKKRKENKPFSLLLFVDLEKRKYVSLLLQF